MTRTALGSLAGLALLSLVPAMQVRAWAAPYESALAATPGQDEPSPKKLSRELQELADDDQEDQKSPEADELTRAFLLRQKARADRCLEILAAGGVRSANDYRNAALLLQHGQTVDHYLLGHVLGSVAMFEGGAQHGVFLATATLDRFLIRLDKAACFGTHGMTSESPITWNASIRKELEIVASGFGGTTPPPKKGKKAFKSKALKSHFKAFTKEQKKFDAQNPKDVERRREHLAWAMQLVAEGELTKDKEYFQAATILYAGETTEQLLAAHVLAMIAAKKGHKEGRQLSAMTLDRWLLSMERAQLFGTQRTEDEQQSVKEPWEKRFPDSVREDYGLEALADSEGK